MRHPLLDNVEDDETTVTAEEAENDETLPEDDTEPTEEDPPLGPGGEKALRAERQKNRLLAAENKRLKTLNPPVEKKAPDEEAISARVRSEVMREFGVKLVRAEAVNVLIQEGFLGNPRRGARLLELEEVISDDGTIDEEALRDAVASLKDDDPNLFKKPRKAVVDEDDEDDEPPSRRARRRPSGDPELGRRKSRTEDDDPLAKALGSLVGRRELA